MVVIFVVLCGANTIKFCISVIYHFIDFMNICSDKNVKKVKIKSLFKEKVFCCVSMVQLQSIIWPCL